MLAIEMALGIDGALERKRCTHSFDECFFVGNRERTWVAHAHRTHGFVRTFVPCIVVATAEHFRLRVCLCVDFQPDDDF